jgi:hypothetical protein
MKRQIRVFPLVFWVVTICSIPSLAQTPGPQTNSTPQAQEQLPNVAPNANTVDTVANEIGLLRKSLQTLNIRLREISEKVLASDAKGNSSPAGKPDRLANNLDLLIRVEQRAEGLRKDLLDRIEKETLLRNRLVQIEEDMRPENIERALNPFGTTRTAELRDNRRRILESERRGFESLLNQTAQSRVRLEEDVKKADSLVVRLRQRILPLIEKEIEKLNPNPN